MLTCMALRKKQMNPTTLCCGVLSMKKVVLSLTPQRFVYHISCFVAKSNLSTFVAKFFLLAGVSTQMSDSDEVMSLVESVSDGNLSESSDLDEMKVTGIVQPYAEEPTETFRF